MSAQVEAGRVGRPHGLDGSFHVTRPLVELLELGTRVTIAGRETEIERRSGTDAKPIVRVGLLTTRNEVDDARGEPVWASRDDALPLEEDEFWADDLVGMRVFDGEREIGEVSRVRALPSCEVLQVGDLLIPLVEDAVRSIDLGTQRIDVDMEFLGEG